MPILDSITSVWADNSSRLPYVALGGFLGYVGLCSTLRFQRINRLQNKYGFTTRESLSRMTNDEAQQISLMAAQFEFPLFYDLALRVALFRTYAVENVGKLLVQVSDLAKSSESAKRYEDTEVLFTCFVKFAPDSAVLHKAIARMNYLHSSYVKSGKILNKDLLYVLWASMRHPVIFMERYEWRPLTDMEVAAIAQMWRYVGTMMEIDYEAELGRKEWSNGVEFMEDLNAWACTYEDEYLHPLPEVKLLGDVLIELLLSAYPAIARPVGYQAVSVMLGERLRYAFGLPEPSIAAITLVNGALWMRKFVLRYLSLPRMIGVDYLSDPDKKTGRMHKLRYLKEPWYNPSTIWTRWGPVAIVSRLAGVEVPGSADKKPEGLAFEDLGPRGKMGKGNDEVNRLEGEAKKRVSGSCPFSSKVAS